ncbi:hypothetical protein GQR58_027867 [Nymphon striatum]|nr:hypothetical protein GQR58_027867 [Nymphon striatum]
MILNLVLFSIVISGSIASTKPSKYFEKHHGPPVDDAKSRIRNIRCGVKCTGLEICVGYLTSANNPCKLIHTGDTISQDLKEDDYWFIVVTKEAIEDTTEFPRQTTVQSASNKKLILPKTTLDLIPSVVKNVVVSKGTLSTSSTPTIIYNNEYLSLNENNCSFLWLNEPVKTLALTYELKTSMTISNLKYLTRYGPPFGYYDVHGNPGTLHLPSAPFEGAINYDDCQRTCASFGGHITRIESADMLDLFMKTAVKRNISFAWFEDCLYKDFSNGDFPKQMPCDQKVDAKCACFIPYNEATRLCGITTMTSNGKCYKGFDYFFTTEMSKAHCEELGMRLAVIKSKEEYSTAQSAINTAVLRATALRIDVKLLNNEVQSPADAYRDVDTITGSGLALLSAFGYEGTDDATTYPFLCEYSRDVELTISTLNGTMYDEKIKTSRMVPDESFYEVTSVGPLETTNSIKISLVPINDKQNIPSGLHYSCIDIDTAIEDYDTKLTEEVMLLDATQDATVAQSKG